MQEDLNLKKIARGLPFYLPLFGVFLAGIIAFVVFQYDRYFQTATAIAMALGYVAWGIVYHILHKDLDLEIVVEYLVYALLGLIVLLSIIFRA